MEIKDMNMKEIEARMAEIAKELDSPEADIDALETEVRSLNARKEELNKKAEKRTALLKSVEENGVVVRSFAEKKEERALDASSKEYRNAFLKNLLGEDMSKEERAAFVNRQLVETRQGTKVITKLLEKTSPDSHDGKCAKKQKDCARRIPHRAELPWTRKNDFVRPTVG